MVNCLINTYMLLFLTSQMFHFVDSECSRSISRIVRNVFKEDLFPSFSDLEVAIPTGCPFSVQHDTYGIQESQKFTDSPSKWTCGFCGKSFYDERFLDKHFDTKHSDKGIKGDDAVCLGDYCDIFRCDIISGRVKAHFWDLALCKESDMAKLSNKCQHLISSCVSLELNYTQRSILLDRFNHTLCSYLTCERFWETTDIEFSRRKTVVYIVASVTVMFALFVYYFVAYTHFYTDDSLIDVSRRRRLNRQETAYRRNNNGHIRQRLNVPPRF